jgi:hypothetical protein
LSSRKRAAARYPGSRAKLYELVLEHWVPDISLARNSGMTVLENI